MSNFVKNFYSIQLKPYAKDTSEKMKTDLKLCDRDGDGENP